MVTPIAGPKVGIQLIFPSMKQLNIAPVANATSPKVNGYKFFSILFSLWISTTLDI